LLQASRAAVVALQLSSLRPGDALAPFAASACGGEKGERRGGYGRLGIDILPVTVLRSGIRKEGRRRGAA